MKISALSSGSAGNAFYVENDKNNKAVLVDCGISCKRIEERLLGLNKTPESVKGIFLTHEHSDHVKGTDVFARKFNIPIFTTQKIIDKKFLCKNSDLINSIKNDETTKMNGLNIIAFPKSHLSVDPVSFSIFDAKQNKTVSVITDAGFACKNICDNVASANLLCIESNHDLKMLEEGPYPWHLKKWIKSDIGHLSNTQAACCVAEHATKKLKNIVLSHLSEHNNTSEKAIDTFNYMLKQRKDLSPELHYSEKIAATPLLKV
jgi:phosphoribosyl 1,2-cyclic phosphodiesterase